ncbi:hypothetical protein LCGC14_1581440 [marine sediment metagenome]|uniref:Uncharacterized protein n=1 Tax=marine sediment metagenome TaxID=412755 RepID=A0A0F9LH01_9ZZZZ
MSEHDELIDEIEDRAIASQETIIALKSDLAEAVFSLKGMLESYDVLIDIFTNRVKNPTLVGTLEGAFVGEIENLKSIIAKHKEDNDV